MLSGDDVVDIVDKCPELENLNLNYCEFSVEYLQKIVSKAKRFQNLDLKDCTINCKKNTENKENYDLFAKFYEELLERSTNITIEWPSVAGKEKEIMTRIHKEKAEKDLVCCFLNMVMKGGFLRIL